MTQTPEYKALRKIMNTTTGSCEKYVAKVDSLACDAVMNYEFKQDDLLEACLGALQYMSRFPQSDTSTREWKIANQLRAAIANAS